MTPIFDEKSYILGFWYSETPNELINHLTYFWKENNKWHGLMRTRIVKDNKIFDSDDEKSFTNITPKESKTEDELISIMDEIQEMAALRGMKTDSLLIRGGSDKLLELAKTKPWMHFKCEPTKEG